MSAPAAPPTGDRAVVVDIRRGPRLAPRVPIGTTSALAKRFLFWGRSGGARSTARSAASGFEKVFDREVESPFTFYCAARPDPIPDHFRRKSVRALPKLTRVRVGRHGVHAYQADGRPNRVRAAHGLGARQAQWPGTLWPANLGRTRRRAQESTDPRTGRRRRQPRRLTDVNDAPPTLTDDAVDTFRHQRHRHLGRRSRCDYVESEYN